VRYCFLTKSIRPTWNGALRWECMPKVCHYLTACRFLCQSRFFPCRQEVDERLLRFTVSNFRVIKSDTIGTVENFLSLFKSVFFSAELLLKRADLTRLHWNGG
jgi:hypothetical protein